MCIQSATGKCLLVLALFLTTTATNADDTGTVPASAGAILERYVARDEGDHVRRFVTIVTRDKSGNERTRHALSCRKMFGADRRLVFFFLSPGSRRGTGVLTFDYADPVKADDQWLYMPSARKTRRIYAGGRGDFFAGTDLTYEEMKKETKISVEDFTLSFLAAETLEGRACAKVQAIPINEKIARALKYARAVHWIEIGNLMPRRTEYYGENGQLLRTVVMNDIEQIDGIWTVTRLTARTEATGHTTELSFSRISYNTPISDRMFTEQALILGPRWH